MSGAAPPIDGARPDMWGLMGWLGPRVGEPTPKDVTQEVEEHQRSGCTDEARAGAALRPSKAVDADPARIGTLLAPQTLVPVRP